MRPLSRSKSQSRPAYFFIQQLEKVCIARQDLFLSPADSVKSLFALSFESLQVLDVQLGVSSVGFSLLLLELLLLGHIQFVLLLDFLHVLSDLPVQLAAHTSL